MIKGKKKIIAVAVIAALLLVTLCGASLAISMEAKMFKNNTPTYIKLGQTVTNTISSSTDRDYYMFDIPSDGILNLSFVHDNFEDKEKVGWNLSLYKVMDENPKSFKEIALISSYWDDTENKPSPIGVSAGTYCVVIKGGVYFRESDYKFTSSFEIAATYEKEPNDTKETATYMGLGYGKYGISSQRENTNDIDWFEFDIKEDVCVNILFTHNNQDLPQVGWTVNLMNENGDTICQFPSRLMDAQSESGSIGLRQGKYYVAVETQSEFSKGYCVIIGTERVPNTEYELNDSINTAMELPENYEIQGSLSDRMISLDKDYYRIYVPSDGTVDITLKHDSLEKDKDGWNVRLIKIMEDGSEHQIVKRISKWNEPEMKIANIGVSKGDYFICIDGDAVSYTFESYICSWAFNEKQGFEKEPNGTKDRAELISVNKRYDGAILSSGTFYDEDYYKLQLSRDVRLCLEFGHNVEKGSNVCWIASIIDESDKELLTISSQLNEGLVTTRVVELPAGTYYVKIETGMFGSDIPYYFTVVGDGN